MKIKRFTIKNFRSLQDVTVPGLEVPAVVFHGPNNSGKSNLLLALDYIFSEKETSVASDVAARMTPFWHGDIRKFSDNFYMGGSDDIEFEIFLDVTPALIDPFLNPKIIEKLQKAGHNYQVKFVGKITKNGDDGQIHLEKYEINSVVAMESDGEGNITSFPSYKGIDDEDKRRSAEFSLNAFNNAVSVIHANRYLTTEDSHDSKLSLSSENFKSWLHKLSLSREDYSIYKRICEWFSNPPFEFGSISFLQENGQLELMVEDKSGFRMPIASKGSGIQQILVLLGYIANNSSHIICVEEPELNMSFKNQDTIVTMLISLLNTDKRVSQLFLTSHSDHVGSRDELKQFHVENPHGTGTSVREFTTKDRTALFPRRRSRR